MSKNRMTWSAVLTAAIVLGAACAPAPSENPERLAPAPAGAAPTTLAPRPTLNAPTLRFDGGSIGSVRDAATNTDWTFTGSHGEVVVSTAPGEYLLGAPTTVFAIVTDSQGPRWVRAVESNGRLELSVGSGTAGTVTYEPVLGWNCPANVTSPHTCTDASVRGVPLKVTRTVMPKLEIVVSGAAPGINPVSFSPGTAYEASVGVTNMATIPAGATGYLYFDDQDFSGQLLQMYDTDATWPHQGNHGWVRLTAVFGWGCDPDALDIGTCSLVTNPSASRTIRYNAGS